MKGKDKRRAKGKENGLKKQKGDRDTWFLYSFMSNLFTEYEHIVNQIKA